MRHTFTSKVASLFRELPDFTEDVETELNLFKSAVITSATASCGCKRVGGQTGSEKRTAWCNQEVKEAIHAKKTAFRAWLTKSHLISFDCGTPQHVRLPPLLSKSLKKSHGKNLEKSWIQTTDWQTKLFCKPYVVCVAKNTSSHLHREYNWCASEASKGDSKLLERILL